MKIYMFIFALFLFSVTPAQRANKNYNNIMKSTSIYEIDAFLRDAHPDDPRRSILKPRLMNMIKDYIKTAHPEDRRVKEMQEKLALLKTRSSTKISFEEMNAKIKERQIKYYQEELNRINSGYYSKQKTVAQANTIPATEADADKALSSTTIAKTTTKPTTSTTISTKTLTATASKSSYVNPEQAEFDMLMNPSVQEHKNQTVKILNALFNNDPSSKDTTVMIKNNSDCDMIMRIEGTGTTKYRLAIRSKSENTIVVDKGQYLFSSLVCGAQYASQKTVQKAIIVTLGNPPK